jgi:hypothetical protein
MAGMRKSPQAVSGLDNPNRDLRDREHSFISGTQTRFAGSRIDGRHFRGSGWPRSVLSLSSSEDRDLGPCVPMIRDAANLGVHATFAGSGFSRSVLLALAGW